MARSLFMRLVRKCATWLTVVLQLPRSLEFKYEPYAVMMHNQFSEHANGQLENSSFRVQLSSEACDTPHVTVSANLDISVSGCPCPPGSQILRKGIELKGSSAAQNTRHENLVHPIVVTRSRWHAYLNSNASFLSVIREKLSSQGFDVYTVPSIPSIIEEGECAFPRATASQFEYELSVFQLHLKLEDAFLARVRSRKHAGGAVVIMDGVLDSKTRISAADWDNVLRQNDLAETDLFQRYDGVLLFGFANTVSGDLQAKDARLKSVWAGHPNRIIVTRAPSGEQEKENALNAVRNILDGLVGESRATRKPTTPSRFRIVIVIAVIAVITIIIAGIVYQFVYWMKTCSVKGRQLQQQHQKALDEQQHLKNQMAEHSLAFPT